MTSYEDYEQLENCGVDFDSSCFGGEDYYNYLEDIGECEEDDQKCISRYLHLKNKSKTNLSKNTSKSFRSGEKDGSGTLSRRISSHTRNSPISPSLLPNKIPDPGYFEGLPKDYYKKNFKPDYPADLQMVQVCTTKQARRRTLGVTHTQPRAKFLPSESTLLGNQNAGSKPVSPATNKSLTSTVVPEVPKGIFSDDPSPLEQNRLPPQVVSSSDEVIVDWIESHNVQMMFEYFLGLCVIRQPENPWAFISELCGKMIEARDDLTAFDNLPRILTPEHTEAIFRVYDRIENGFITVPQYKSAMEAMGLNRFSANPEGWEENAISKDTFVKEATEAIDDLLRTFMVFEPSSEEEKPSKTDQKAPGDPNRPSFSGSGSSSYSYSRSGTGTGTATGSDNQADSPTNTVDDPDNPGDSPPNTMYDDEPADSPPLTTHDDSALEI